LLFPKGQKRGEKRKDTELPIKQRKRPAIVCAKRKKKGNG